MDEFIKFIEKILDSEDLIEFIYDFIKFILEFYEQKKLKEKILVVLDDYDDSFDYNNNISKIIDYINKLLLLILSECPYINKKYYNYFLGNHNYDVADWDIPIKNVDKENLFKLSLYHFRYENN